jgi:hypothetical protein
MVDHPSYEHVDVVPFARGLTRFRSIVCFADAPSEEHVPCPLL